MQPETMVGAQFAGSAFASTQETEAARNSALEFLEAMESRHDCVLDELDKLNLRIESVLEQYALGRKEQSQSPRV